MSKNVLIISSSPRQGGNSDILCDEFLRGARESGHNAEKISLKDKKINYCNACGFCYSNGTCAINDDMAEIIEKMKKADTIVFASPIYFYAISGQMKTFIDRLCSGYTQIKNKEFYYILTAADSASDTIHNALGEFQGLMACMENPVEKGYIFGGGVWKKGEIIGTQYLQRAYEMGKNC